MIKIEGMQNDASQQTLLAASRERSEGNVLRLIVHGLAEQPHVALARIWLIGPGEFCATCRMRPECPDQASSLHLAASAGRSLAEPDADWTQIGRDFRRFPLGIRKVGQIGASTTPLLVVVTTSRSGYLNTSQQGTPGLNEFPPTPDRLRQSDVTT